MAWHLRQAHQLAVVEMQVNETVVEVSGITDGELRGVKSLKELE